MELIQGGADKSKPKPDLSMIYLRNFREKATLLMGQLENREILKQMIFYGVKYINSSQSDKPRTYEWLECEIYLITFLISAIGLLTPAELLTIFPLEKQYDGAKYETKDYFYSMKTIREIGLNNVIGDKADKLLWDYCNWDIDNFVVNMMCFLSDIRQLEGETSVMEEFSELLGLTIYTLFKGTNGHEYLQNTTTGQIQRLIKQKPRYLRPISN